MPWIGDIPEHWILARNKAFLLERKETVGKRTEYPLLSLTREGVIYRDVESGKGKFPKDFDTYKIVSKGDVIFCLFDVDETPRTVGLSEIVGMITGAYNVFAIHDINKRFLYYFYIAIDDKKGMRPLYTGLRKVINVNKFLSAKIAIPTPAEQEKIVAFLDKQTNLIESCICLRERELQTLIELKQAKIASAVTRGLNPDVPMKDSGIPWIGMIPAHWEIKKLKYLFNERSEKGYPDEPVLCSTQKYGVIPQSLYENRVVVVNKGLEGLKLVEVGDFVISLRSFQGGIEYAYYRGIISAAYTVLSPRKGINSEYLKHLLKSQPFIELLKTCVTGIREGQNINYSLLKNKEWAFPPPEEQDAIISYLTNRNIDEYIKSLEKEIEYLKEYKQRLISDVVTGKVDVRDEA